MNYNWYSKAAPVAGRWGYRSMIYDESRHLTGLLRSQFMDALYTELRQQVLESDELAAIKKVVKEHLESNIREIVISVMVESLKTAVATAMENINTTQQYAFNNSASVEDLKQKLGLAGLPV